MLTFTIPELRSPYSADGTPVMTSTDSMLSTDRLLVSIPFIPASPALLPILTPSISRAVPKAALASEEPPALRERALAEVRSGLTVFPPGRRATISAIFDICRWSMASRPRVWDVLRPSLGRCAVTTTSSRASELTDIRMTRLSRSRDASSSRDVSTYPRQLAFST